MFWPAVHSCVAKTKRLRGNMLIVLEQITCFGTKRNGPAVKAPQESPVYLSCGFFWLVGGNQKETSRTPGQNPAHKGQNPARSLTQDQHAAGLRCPTCCTSKINKHILHKLNHICMRAAGPFIVFVFLRLLVLRSQRLHGDFCVFCVLLSTIKRQILLFIAN